MMKLSLAVVALVTVLLANTNAQFGRLNTGLTGGLTEGVGGPFSRTRGLNRGIGGGLTSNGITRTIGGGLPGSGLTGFGGPFGPFSNTLNRARNSGGDDNVVRTSSSSRDNPVRTSTRTFRDNSGPVVVSNSFSDVQTVRSGNVDGFDDFGPSEFDGGVGFSSDFGPSEGSLLSDSDFLNSNFEDNTEPGSSLPADNNAEDPFGPSESRFGDPFGFENRQPLELSTSTRAPKRTLNANTFGGRGRPDINGKLTQQKGVITVSAQITGGDPVPKRFEWTVQQPDGSFEIFDAGEKGSTPVIPGDRINPATVNLTIDEPADIKREITLKVGSDPLDPNAWSISRSWVADETPKRFNKKSSGANVSTDSPPSAVEENAEPTRQRRTRPPTPAAPASNNSRRSSRGTRPPTSTASPQAGDGKRRQRKDSQA